MQYPSSRCPGIINDSRFLSNYLPSAQLATKIADANGLQDSNEIRRFLQNNAVQLINQEHNAILKDNTCKNNTACGQGYANFIKADRNWANAIPPVPLNNQLRWIKLQSK